MLDKKTVFILGAGASCPCGYPSGARLRELICHGSGFMKHYNDYVKNHPSGQVTNQDIKRFTDTFAKSHIKSIDLFMSKNPKLAPFGKYIIAFEIFRSEKQSCFAEEAKWHQEQRERSASSDNRSVREYCEGTADFTGGDWYSYIYNRFIERQVVKDALPDFSGGELAFITFNYDRSLEQFFYESLRSSFTEAPEDHIVESLNRLKILHAYGQIAPLKWQDAHAGVEYKPQEIDEPFLQSAAKNIKTIYEEKESAELAEAHRLIESAHRIFFLGFGYRPENMDVLNLPDLIRGGCEVRGTAFNMIEEEVKRILDTMPLRRKGDGSSYSGSYNTRIEPCDCLMLLRKYL